MTPSSFHVSQTAAYVLLHAPICNTDGVFIVNKFRVRDQLTYKKTKRVGYNGTLSNAVFRV